MPAHSVIDIDNRIVLSVFSGVLTLRDVTDQVATLRDDPAFDPGFSELVDLSMVSEVRMDDADFKSLSEIDPFSTTAKRALVGISPHSTYAAARMYRVMRNDGVCVQVFKTKQEAFGWLV